MKIADKELAHHLELLRHGGADAIVLFVEIARKLYEQGEPDYISSWVTVASPALPEVDRHAAFTLLLRALFGEYDIGAEVLEEHPTLQ